MMEPKTVCYYATRDIYPNVKASLNSLLHNGGIDEVIVCAEDDDLGYPLPANVTVVNVSGQKWFPEDGPNYKNHWSYIVMLKCAAAYQFPKLKKLVTLDVDTIVLRDISDLWDIDMTGYCLAGVEENLWYDKHEKKYINAGVCLWNLEEMRKGWAATLCKMLNERLFMVVEQDAISEVLEGRIMSLDGAYNATRYTVQGTQPDRILHYAGWGQEKFVGSADAEYWMGVDWPERGTK